jgi:hypothetical protein
METESQPVPHARREGLVVQELPDELMVYDLDRHRSHCLNRAAALVWRYCDGKTTVAEMSERLQREFAQPFEEDVVWLALHRLHKAHLLQPIELPRIGFSSSRRALMRRMAMVGGAALVASIPAPSSAAAASGGVVGSACTKNSDCNPGLHCCLRSNGIPTCDASDCGTNTCPLGCVHT